MVRVLVTTDTFSGVWTHARELVSGLVTHGAQVTLVSFGEIPLPDQTAWMQGLHGLEFHPTAFRLDWMQEGEQDFYAAQEYLCEIVRDTRPDFLHLNQLSFGAIPVSTPRLVVANGDVVTWWLTIHGREPSSSEWLEWYRATVMSLLSSFVGSRTQSGGLRGVIEHTGQRREAGRSDRACERAQQRRGRGEAAHPHRVGRSGGARRGLVPPRPPAADW